MMQLASRINRRSRHRGCVGEAVYLSTIPDGMGFSMFQEFNDYENLITESESLMFIDNRWFRPACTLVADEDRRTNQNLGSARSSAMTFRRYVWTETLSRPWPPEL